MYMEPLESTLRLINDIVEASYISPAETEFTVNMDPDLLDMYKRDSEILMKLIELITADSTKSPTEVLDKLMNDQLSIVCSKDEEIIHNAMGLCRDILAAVNKWI